jgi:hypothetical protein
MWKPWLDPESSSLPKKKKKEIGKEWRTVLEQEGKSEQRSHNCIVLILNFLDVMLEKFSYS